jgi:hypothetical protein
MHYSILFVIFHIYILILGIAYQQVAPLITYFVVESEIIFDNFHCSRTTFECG